MYATYVRPRADPVSRHVYKNIEILQANSVDLLSFVVHFSKNETCIINYAQFIKQNQRKKYLYDNKLTKKGFLSKRSQHKQPM